MIKKATGKKTLTSSEVKILADTLRKTYLLRLAGLADFIGRFIDIQLKNRVNWLKIFALSLIIVGGGMATPSELGRIMLRSNENMTRLVDVLVREGLVKRYRSENDRRSVRIKLTRQGFDYVRKILVDIEKEEKLVMSWLSVSERQSLENIMNKLSANFKEQIRNGI